MKTIPGRTAEQPGWSSACAREGRGLLHKSSCTISRRNRIRPDRRGKRQAGRKLQAGIHGLAELVLRVQRRIMGNRRHGACRDRNPENTDGKLDQAKAIIQPGYRAIAENGGNLRVDHDVDLRGRQADHGRHHEARDTPQPGIRKIEDEAIAEAERRMPRASSRKTGSFLLRERLIAMETIGCSPQCGISGDRKIPARMQQILKADEAIAGTKKRPQALSSPIATAAREIHEKKRRHDARHLHR